MGVKPNLQYVNICQTNLCILSHQRAPDVPVMTAYLAISDSDRAREQQPT